MRYWCGSAIPNRASAASAPRYSTASGSCSRKTASPFRSRSATSTSRTGHVKPLSRPLREGRGPRSGRVRVCSKEPARPLNSHPLRRGPFLSREKREGKLSRQPPGQRCEPLLKLLGQPLGGGSDRHSGVVELEQGADPGCGPAG